MENCGLTRRISGIRARGDGGSKIDDWSLMVDAKVDLRRLSHRTLSRYVDRVGTFTPRYDTTEQLPNFACKSGTYHAFLLACPQGVRKEDCWVDHATEGGAVALSRILIGLRLVLCRAQRSRSVGGNIT